jgi:hypothetical protein
MEEKPKDRLWMCESLPPYSFHERLGDYEYVVTFATHKELVAYIETVLRNRDSKAKRVGETK